MFRSHPNLIFERPLQFVAGILSPGCMLEVFGGDLGGKKSIVVSPSQVGSAADGVLGSATG